MSCNIHIINNLPKNNNESNTNNNIDYLVKSNGIINNISNSINLNNTYSEIIDQSINNVAVLTNYNPSMLYKFSTTNNGNNNSTNKRRNIILHIRYEHDIDSITKRLSSTRWKFINDIRSFIFKFNNEYKCFPTNNQV